MTKEAGWLFGSNGYIVREVARVTVAPRTLLGRFLHASVSDWLNPREHLNLLMWAGVCC